eukprot:6860624-Prymnesium_polylepis.2
MAEYIWRNDGLTADPVCRSGTWPVLACLGMWFSLFRLDRGVGNHCIFIANSSTVRKVLCACAGVVQKVGGLLAVDHSTCAWRHVARSRSNGPGTVHATLY